MVGTRLTGSEGHDNNVYTVKPHETRHALTRNDARVFFLDIGDGCGVKKAGDYGNFVLSFVSFPSNNSCDS
jgi:hypothetical protein